MADGDLGVADGMPLVPGSLPANTIDTQFNKTQDFIAARHNEVRSVARGGTGGSSASAARAALGVPATGDVVATSSLALPDFAQAGKVPVYNGSGQLTSAAPSLGGHVVPLSTLLGGFTTFGEVYLPNSSAASSGWTAAYINADGRICRGASTERVKKYITVMEPSAFGDIFVPLNRYQMKGGDGRWTYGHTAERLAKNTDTEHFVMYDDEGKPASIDYIPLLLAKVEQLHARVLELEAAR